MTATATERQSSREQRSESQYAVDPGLSLRIAAGLATPEEIQRHRAQANERDKEKRAMRASRVEEYAGMDEAQRKNRVREVEREFEEVSDEMRSMNDTQPLWHERRERKLELAFELEDLKLSLERRRYDDVRADKERRTASQKQLDVAKNAPFNEGGAPIVEDGTAEGLPGSVDPPEGEQDLNVDSGALLKGTTGRGLSLEQRIAQSKAAQSSAVSPALQSGTQGTIGTAHTDSAAHAAVTRQ